MGSKTSIRLLTLSVLLFSINGCAHRGSKAKPPVTAAIQPATIITDIQPISAEVKTAATLPPPIDPVVNAKVASYTVSPSLNEVSNLNSFTRVIAISPQQKELLAKNLFVCAPTNTEQLFYVYEHNDYANLPSFITTDLVLQIYHMFFDSTLKSIEEEYLIKRATTLTKGMLQVSQYDYENAKEPKIKDAALRNTAYFAVAARCLNIDVAGIPVDAQAMVDNEIKAIESHADTADSSIFPNKIDYSQFVPRGHYTRSDALKQYFKAMMWYGLVPFSFYNIDTHAFDENITQQVLLITHDLYKTRLINDWEAIYEPTTFYVGLADDVTPMQINKIIHDVYGNVNDINTLTVANNVDKLKTACDKLPKPGIQTKLLRVPGGKQFRFMGQRYIPDSDMTQRIANTEYKDRLLYPSGLDVMSVLGSKRAYIHQGIGEEATLHNNVCQDMEKEFNALPPDKWYSNMYWSWLSSLKSLNVSFSDGYPSFMRNDAWMDKSLNTSLASWAELRHDTILYAKQSATECGGDEKEPPFVKGYVEPNVVFYSRLLFLAKQSANGLKVRGLLSDDTKQHFEDLENLIQFLKTASEKELRNEKLTQEEYLTIRHIGGEFEQLTLRITQSNANTWELVNGADKDIAIIADVHTGFGSALEEAVGHVNEILVIVPIEGKLTLTRGATFSYYEFGQPMSDRLTDEKWQEMLKKKTNKPAPEWTKSFIVPHPAVPINEKNVVSYSGGGC